MLRFLANLPRRQKQLLMLCCDVVILPVAFWSAVALRYSSLSPEVYIPFLPWVLAATPILALPVFIPLGLYRTVIRYADERLMATVVYGVTLLAVMLAAFVFMLGVMGIPRSSFVIFWFLAIGFIGLTRFMARKLVLSVESHQLVEKRQRIAIYGAGKAGVQLAMALRSSVEYQILAFFDDKVDLHGTTLFGTRVFSPRHIEKVIGSYGLQGVVLALPSVSRTRRTEIIEMLEPYGLSLKILPGMAEIVGGKVRVEDLREVGIEDLLGRDPVAPDPSLLSSCIREKSVLVTGAGGSIGSELCRQILKENPHTLVLYDSSEFSLYKLEQELRGYALNSRILTVLGDVRHEVHVESVLLENRVQTVYHAAAYKHVPMVEWNAPISVENNVFGTLRAAKAAISAGVQTFVLISTDKAVRPTNVMGASKRLAELALQALAKLHEGTGNTKLCMVRFGNVLGSSGSVVPLFKEQIQRGGPVTVTHPDVTRYFMTIPEAAQLVLQSGSMACGGDVFVLDMGESIKIVELAEKMVHLSGLSLKNEQNPEGDISIEFTGLRPGEKLYEELLIGENVLKTPHPRIVRAEESFIPWNLLAEELAKISLACKEQDASEVKRLLQSCVIEYVPGPEAPWARLSPQNKHNH